MLGLYYLLAHTLEHVIERLVSILLLHSQLWACLVLNRTLGVLHFLGSPLPLLEPSFNSPNRLREFVAGFFALGIFFSIVFIAEIIKKIKLVFDLCIDKKVPLHF